MWFCLLTVTIQQGTGIKLGFHRETSVEDQNTATSVLFASHASQISLWNLVPLQDFTHWSEPGTSRGG